MSRKLASIQKINNIEPIEGADLIEKVSVLGWSCVAKKGEFQLGDLCVYFEIDSFLPEREEFEFLRKSSFRKMNDEGGFRLRTVKLRNQISQGLVMPVSKLIKDESLIKEGNDVTELLGIKKWDPQIPAQLRGVVKGNFPGFLIKTDEVRIQSEPDLLNKLQNKPYYITTKLDGTSGTFYFNENFGVCSRNLELKESEGNTYWEIAKKFNLEKALSSHGEPICIQGEICGPGIQKNPLKLSGFELFVFNVFDINTGNYFSLDQMKEFCSKNNLNTVPIEEEDDLFKYNSISELLDKASGKYDSGVRKEGIVIRESGKVLNSRISFKVINNEYLLKNEE